MSPCTNVPYVKTRARGSDATRITDSACNPRCADFAQSVPAGKSRIRETDRKRVRGFVGGTTIPLPSVTCGTRAILPTCGHDNSATHGVRGHGLIPATWRFDAGREIDPIRAVPGPQI